MNFVLLDDVAAHNRLLRRLLLDVCCAEGIEANIALETTDMQAVMDYAALDPPATVYLLDIQLEQEQTGLDLCRKLGKDRPGDFFIFITAYPHYALECLKLHAYDLLVKPVMREDLCACLRSLRKEALKTADRIVLRIPIGSRTVCVPSDQVYFIEVHGRSVTAHTAQGDFTWRSTLTELQKMLSEKQYVRIHRQYLVNRFHVQEWNDAEDTVLVHGESLHFSRRMRKNII